MVENFQVGHLYDRPQAECFLTKGCERVDCGVRERVELITKKLLTDHYHK